MAELLEVFLKAVIHAWQQLIEREDAPLLFRKLLTGLETLFNRAIMEATVLPFTIAIVIAVVVVCVVFVAQLIIGRRRARVFISFQHEHEPIADTFVSELASSGIIPRKLPFVENPDHDTLLDQVKQEIRHCDVFVCVPGSRPSFVESEVSMAFGLDKPLLFVLIGAADKPRLPNTAKKGYPVFALEPLQRERFRTLVNLCSYLAADWRSTVRLYGAIFAHPVMFAGLFITTYLVGILVMLGVMGRTPIPKAIDLQGSPLLWVKAILFDPPTFCFVVVCLVLFVSLYGWFMRNGLRLRTTITRAIATKQFSDSVLPEILDYSLTRADLVKVLYASEILAEHESGSSAENATSA